MPFLSACIEHFPHFWQFSCPLRIVHVLLCVAETCISCNLLSFPNNGGAPWYLLTGPWPLYAQYIKKGDPEDVCNYRPVSLTSIIFYILERIFKRAFLSFLSDTRSIIPNQHGFLPCWSCLSNLLVFEEAVTSMIDEGDTVDLIYLDFAKSFDSVNHRFLSAKMKFFGLGDVVVRWIEVYLSGRVSRVQNTRGPFQCTVVSRRAP